MCVCVCLVKPKIHFYVHQSANCILLRSETERYYSANFKELNADKMAASNLFVRDS